MSLCERLPRCVVDLLDALIFSSLNASICSMTLLLSCVFPSLTFFVLSFAIFVFLWLCQSFSFFFFFVCVCWQISPHLKLATENMTLFWLSGRFVQRNSIMWIGEDGIDFTRDGFFPFTPFSPFSNLYCLLVWASGRWDEEYPCARAFPAVLEHSAQRYQSLLGQEFCQVMGCSGPTYYCGGEDFSEVPTLPPGALTFGTDTNRRLLLTKGHFENVLGTLTAIGLNRLAHRSVPTWLQDFGSQLEIVQLLDNGITFLGRGAFKGPSVLHEISLTGNIIGPISADVFDLADGLVAPAMEAAGSVCVLLPHLSCTCAPGFAGPGTFCVDQDLYDFCLASLPANSMMKCVFDDPLKISCSAECFDGTSPAWSCRKEYGFLMLESDPLEKCDATSTSTTRSTTAAPVTAGDTSVVAVAAGAAGAGIFAAALIIVMMMMMRRRRAGVLPKAFTSQLSGLLLEKVWRENII
jgi:hypothetical protein